MELEVDLGLVVSVAVALWAEREWMGFVEFAVPVPPVSRTEEGSTGCMEGYLVLLIAALLAKEG